MVTTEPWPLRGRGTLPTPHADLTPRGDTVRLFYGDPAGPVLELKPLRVVDVSLPRQPVTGLAISRPVVHQTATAAARRPSTSGRRERPARAYGSGSGLVAQPHVVCHEPGRLAARRFAPRVASG
jgi:hypothetical protein